MCKVKFGMNKVKFIHYQKSIIFTGKNQCLTVQYNSLKKGGHYV